MRAALASNANFGRDPLVQASARKLNCLNPCKEQQIKILTIWADTLNLSKLVAGALAEMLHLKDDQDPLQALSDLPCTESDKRLSNLFKNNEFAESVTTEITRALDQLRKVYVEKNADSKSFDTAQNFQQIVDKPDTDSDDFEKSDIEHFHSGLGNRVGIFYSDDFEYHFLICKKYFILCVFRFTSRPFLCSYATRAL